MSARDAVIQKKFKFIALINSNEEMKYIMERITFLEESGLLMKGVSETIENEAIEQKGGLLDMKLGTLGPSLLGNMLPSKGLIRAGEGTIRAG